MKKLLALLLLCALCACLFASCKDDGKTQSKSYSSAYAVIQFRNYDPVVVALDYANAPITVKNFCKLADSGFYDGLTIIRIQEGFVVQGGDPTAVGRTDEASTIKGEFSDNGVNNKLSHKKGVISMARSNDYNSASSQFFLCLDDTCTSSLDGKYAGFGTVISGWQSAEDIVLDYGAYASGSMGFIDDADNQPVIDSVRIYYSYDEVESLIRK